jgi:5-(carboxyamino)imidazole ribonucleotide mutase
MKRLLVVFGSDSDRPVFEPLLQKLGEKGIGARLEVCSAHRQPKRLVEILGNSEEKLVIAGAGLSAALPGFIASHSQKLVIGLPVRANYSGLDALLSIHQMPKGFAVLGTGVEAVNEAAEGAEKILKGAKKIVLVKPEGEEALKRFGACKEKLAELNQRFEITDGRSYSAENAVFIEFVDLDRAKAAESENALVVFVPVKGDSKENDALKLLALSRKGLWVGLGRGENAALAAKKIIEIGNEE